LSLDPVHRLDGKVAVITGAAGGLGTAIARTFAQLGATGIALLDLDGDGARRLAEALEVDGTAALAIEGDINDEKLVAGAADEVMQRFGRCDVLVNNAGMIRWSPLEDLDVAEWDASMAANLRGHFLCTKHFGRLLLAGGNGSVINVTSIAASLPDAFGGAYSPAKAGAVMLARMAAVEWGARGVRANAVCPGVLRTPMAAAFLQDAHVEARRRAMVAQQRIGDAAELAQVVAFLASDAASYVTGQVINVDGGLSQMLVRLLPKPGAMPDLL
jgi:NAD(P)-dependent dehydrogenase (short-subunit alcohol dehydrogenase family)